MPLLERGERQIHYSCEGEGPGVVLVPGLGSGARLFGTLPRRFARAGYTCAVVDPVGIPPSGPLPDARYDFAAAAADVLAVAASLPRPVALVGTSLGGKVALVAAAAAPESVDRLVLLASSALTTPRSRRIYRWFELLASEVDPRWLGEMTAPFLFGETFLNERPAVVDDLIRSMRPAPETRSMMRAQAQALQQFDGSAAAAAVQCATLCLAGSEDTLTLPSEVAQTAARIRGAEHECFARAGHSLLLESAAVLTRVLDFLGA